MFNLLLNSLKIIWFSINHLTAVGQFQYENPGLGASWKQKYILWGWS